MYSVLKNVHPVLLVAPLLPNSWRKNHCEKIATCRFQWSLVALPKVLVVELMTFLVGRVCFLDTNPLSPCPTPLRGQMFELGVAIARNLKERREGVANKKSPNLVNSRPAIKGNQWFICPY